MVWFPSVVQLRYGHLSEKQETEVRLFVEGQKVVDDIDLRITEMHSKGYSIHLIANDIGMSYTGTRTRMLKLSLNTKSVLSKTRKGTTSPRTWTDDQLIDIVRKSTTWAECVRGLGLNCKSAGNWRTLQKRCEEIGIDTSHFTGRAARQGGRKLTPLDEVLVKGRYTCSSSLRKRLLKEGMKCHVCEMCGLKEWNGVPIALELDHVNGDRDDNELNNLRLLCPNCHAQTPTWRGRNRKPNANRVVSEVNVINTYKSISDRINTFPTFTDIVTSLGGNGKYLNNKKEIQNICDMNNLEIRTTRIPRKDKIHWPDNVELSSMVMSMSLEAVGRKLGVTGNAVKKRCVKYGIPTKSSAQLSKGHLHGQVR